MIIVALVFPMLPVQAQVPAQFAAAVVSISGPLTLKSGLAGEFAVAVKNTGSTSWSNTGANAVKMGTILPNDHIGKFYHASWLSQNRAASAKEESVSPGGLAHFSVMATAAGLRGNITEYFGLVAEGITWFRGVDIPLTIAVQPARYEATLVSQSVSSLELKARDTATISVQFQNSGDVAWANAGSAAVKIGTLSPTDRWSPFYSSGWLSKNRVASTAGAVGPGERGTFTFIIQAPSKVGSYTEYFGLVAEGITWFSTQFVLNIKVVPAIYDAVWVGQSNNSLSLAPGDTETLWVEFKNTGNTIWQATGDNAVKLGTARALDRVSAFYSEGWLSPNRTVAISPAEVKPGEVARFIFSVEAPDTVGKQYREYFRPVVEAITWLPDFGVYFDISVDEELIIANPMRVGITSTTTPVTIQGAAFVIRRGSDKGLVRKFKNETVTVSPLGYGYSLSTGEQVSDWIRVVPLNNSVITTQTSGIGSTYDTFRGIVEVRRSPISDNIWVVNTLELEDYMKGIAEVPSGWPTEAQKAQMIAARTFAVKKRAESTNNDIFDVYDDTRSQVYYGYNYEAAKPELVAAAQATKGLVITYQGQPINAYYFSDSGGYTENVENVWGKGNPAAGYAYLKGVPDPYTKPILWDFTLTQDYLQSRFDDTLGIASVGSDIIYKIDVTERFPSDRAKTLIFTMRSGRQIGVPFYTFDYLTDSSQIKSMNFTVQTVGFVDKPDFLFEGKGWGHGVGLPQWGARNMAAAGKSASEILAYYYTGVTLSSI